MQVLCAADDVGCLPVLAVVVPEGGEGVVEGGVRRHDEDGRLLARRTPPAHLHVQAAEPEIATWGLSMTYQLQCDYFGQ